MKGYKTMRKHLPTGDLYPPRELWAGEGGNVIVIRFDNVACVAQAEAYRTFGWLSVVDTANLP